MESYDNLVKKKSESPIYGKRRFDYSPNNQMR
jgi:hypothetical protein